MKQQRTDKERAEGRPVSGSTSSNKGNHSAMHQSMSKEEVMKTTNLLVVDDEKVVCDSCSRILGNRGFSVETSTDPKRGLELATKKDYEVILLDLKMPAIDGLEFLKELRKKHKDARVVIITGYSTTENAAACMRLGAVDFIPKPFSPDELLNAVGRLVPLEEAPAKKPAAPAIATAVVEPELAVEEEKAIEYSKEYRFYEEAWVQKAPYNTARVGAFLSTEEARAVTAIQLPKVGDIVYRGLPLATVTMTGKPARAILSPITGHVTRVNSALTAKPTAWEKPCEEAWIAHVRPTDLEVELETDVARTVVLAAPNGAKVEQSIELLTSLGCTVEAVKTVEGAIEAIKKAKKALFMVDAASAGQKGPEMVQTINARYPDVKVVVSGGKGSKHEAEYRANKILYYSVGPWSVPEMIDVLNSVFGPTLGPAPEVAPSRKLPNWISKIRITNRNGKEVNLLASGEILNSHKGLGFQLRDIIAERKCPITFTLGAKNFNVIELIEETDKCDKLVVLEIKDTERIPGSVVMTSGSELLKGMGASEQKIETIVVQPGTEQNAPLVYDGRTSRGLAEFILKEMTKN
jgi:CheY-like chemotaxis protein/glycine cleavage system H lipoate-binding protein